MIARLQMAERTQRDIAAMKVQFLSTMSHEIKTPMNAIHGMFELFSRSELTDRQRRWADAGLSASRNLQAQVTQILEMARLEENTIQVTPRPVDPRKLLQNWIVTTEAGIVVTGKNLSVGGEVAANLPDRVILDEARVQQILINLLTNAVKFSEDGQIGIAMRVLRGALVIEVSDTGIGIAAEDQGLVFERFWQVDSGADRRKDGTGLGLAISRELATLMGGSLTLRSDIAQGSTFRLTLPLLPIGTGDAAP
jgi:signal transduction histidine kinase